jgi:type III pantothenate kinase
MPGNLVLDLGNSRIKWAFAEDGLHDVGARAYGDNFDGTLDEIFGACPRPARALAASVADAVYRDTLAHWLKSRWGLELERIVARDSQLGVTNGYLEPVRLGADRWAALIGARARLPGDVCVVDCGTAVTVDVLDAQGRFRGGVILPGLELMRSSLHQRAPGVRATEGEDRSCLARRTADAVAAGTLFGIAGAIDRIIDEQTAALGKKPQVIVTGGAATQILPHLRHAAGHAPDLVLEGVARIAAAGVTA